MVAYRPAASSEFTRTATSRSMGAGRPGYFGIGATASPVFASFGQTRSSFPPGLFCVTTNGRMAWPVLLNFRTPPGRIESLSSSFASASRIASGFREPALLDGDEEGADRLVRARVVPLGRAARRRLELLVEGLDLGIGEQVGPPAAGEDVVGRGAEPLAPRLVGAAGAVGDHLVVEPHLGVGAVHRDVVLEVGVAHEEVGLRGLDAGQEGLEVGRVELEALVEDDRELLRVRLHEVLHPLLEVLSVLGVLPDEGDLQGRLQLPGPDEVVEELHLGRRRDSRRGRAFRKPTCSGRRCSWRRPRRRRTARRSARARRSAPGRAATRSRRSRPRTFCWAMSCSTSCALFAASDVSSSSRRSILYFFPPTSRPPASFTSLTASSVAVLNAPPILDSFPVTGRTAPIRMTASSAGAAARGPAAVPARSDGQRWRRRAPGRRSTDP